MKIPFLTLGRRGAMLLALLFGLWPISPALAADPVFVDYGAAPNFRGIESWLNSAPLSMSGLRGKVVLVDFWTYSCINCLRTLPYVARWHERYKDQGLAVVGVHTPEFAFERQTSNVQTAIKRFGIRYPVAQDNQYATWKAYENQYWPAVYLIDRTGKIVLKHFGEGRYDEMESAIRTLLASESAPLK
jgi:thiol-disulfide isomerase/thioredoxin